VNGENASPGRPAVSVSTSNCGKSLQKGPLNYEEPIDVVGALKSGLNRR